MISSTYGMHQKSFYKCGISIDITADAATVNTGGYVAVVEPVLLRQQETIWTKNLIAFISPNKSQKVLRKKRMDDLDRQLLNVMQNEFPICEKPFLEIGKKLNICEKEVLARLHKLKSDGIIRRIGGVFDSQHLGYKSSLFAVKVPSGDIESVAEFINQFPGVTHNYQRSHAYNLWFTLSASSPEKFSHCLLYTSDAADDLLCVDLGGR